MSQLATIYPKCFLESAVHRSMTNAKASVAQAATLHKCQSVANWKLLEKGTILQSMKSFALEAIEFSLLLLFLLSRALSLLVVGTRCSMMSPNMPSLLLR